MGFTIKGICEMEKTATISGCGKYRYRLGRSWNDTGLVYAFFGINPSTADALIDDQTVKKWIGFTAHNEGGSFIVGNVFAYRSKNVKDLAKCVDPLGPDLLQNIREIIRDADILVPCWGNISKVPRELRYCFEVLKDQLMASDKPKKCFGYTESGNPKHPLMLPYSTELIDFDLRGDSK